MKTFVRNAYANWVIRLALISLAVAAIAAVAFHEGKRYAAKRLTVTLANEGCFNCWAGLRALKNTNDAKLALLLDIEMDLTGAMLAEMALKYPSLIERHHYNLLIKVRDYRNRYGRDYQRGSGPDAVDVYRRITEAIAYLESIHNTNEWLPFGAEAADLIRELKAKQRK